MGKTDIDQKTVSDILERVTFYNLLAALFSYPGEGNREDVKGLLQTIGKGAVADRLSKALEGTEAAVDGCDCRELEGEYNYLFSGASNCPLYETEYESSIFTKTAQMADIAGFYRAWGLESGGGEKQSPDHVCCQLEFVGFLGQKRLYALYRGWDDRAGLALDVERRFLEDHLGRWFAVFCRLLKKEARSDYYRFSAHLGEAYIEEDLKKLNIKAIEVSGPRPPLETNLCCRQDFAKGSADVE